MIAQAPRGRAARASHRAGWAGTIPRVPDLDARSHSAPVKRRRFLAAALAPGVGAAATPGNAAYRAKMAAFDLGHRDDVWIDAGERALLRALVRRLDRVQFQVGHGNFGIMSFDEMLAAARGHTSVGRFSGPELEFMERVFFAEASRLGFHGRKVTARLTDRPRARRIARVPGSPARLFQGPSLETFNRMRARVGADLVLTSGVRGVVKQFHLFLRKADRADGNLSLASRSLAPPGYSYHGVGDFDVGQRGLGGANFTTAFGNTDVYRRLADLGYARIRYPRDNLLGVRYEPWHIRVVG